MPQLVEVPAPRQIPGEPRRRWFSSAGLDLIVWCDAAGGPRGFQLCFARAGGERALTWQPDTGYSYLAVDDGEHGVGMRHKQTPILGPDGAADAASVRELFVASSAALPRDIVELVITRLQDYPVP